MKIPIAIIAVVLVSACSTSGTDESPRFDRMSPQEIYAYNQNLPIRDQIVCETRTETSSRIRKRRCHSLGDLIDNKQEAYNQLDTIDYGVATGPFGRRNR